MESKTIYFIEPPLDGDYLLNLSQQLSKDGYHISYTEKEIFLRSEMKQVLLEKGATAILSMQPVNEEVLRDSTPRNALLDTLRYKLDRCRPSQSLLIVDPYIYPANPDSDYLTDFITIFEESFKKCATLNFATFPNRNIAFEQQVHSSIQQINPQIQIYSKYTKIFHDRCWIADGSRGLFVGTSFNGIGKRYALVDWLQEDDAKEIVQRYSQIP